MSNRLTLSIDCDRGTVSIDCDVADVTEVIGSHPGISRAYLMGQILLPRILQLLRYDADLLREALDAATKES